MGEEKRLRDYSLWTQLRFWLFSLIGILIFVVPVSIGGTSQIGLVHIGNAITAVLGGFGDYIIYAFALLGLFMLIKERRQRFKGFFNILMSALSVLGIVCMSLYLFGAAPAFLEDERFMPFIMEQVLYPTLLYTGISPLFMPFLLNSGLLEFVGVPLKPVLRPVFKLPGRAAVITVSAFFGSAPVGIVVVDNLYKDGRLTYKEAYLLGTGFATTAISFMVILSGLGGISDYWGLYLGACLLGLAVIAIIQVRLYPTSRIPETTFQNMPYVEEPDAKGGGLLIKRMLLEGYARADEMRNPLSDCLEMLKTSTKLLGNIMASTCGMVVVGLAINYYTPLLDWLGYLFYPFAFITGLGDPVTVGKGAASALFVPSLPAVYAAEVSALASKVVLCSMPVLGIISIPLTMPVFFNATVKYKAKDLLLLYVERTVLTTIVVGIIVHIYVWLFI